MRHGNDSAVAIDGETAGSKGHQRNRGETGLCSALGGENGGNEFFAGAGGKAKERRAAGASFIGDRDSAA